MNLDNFIAELNSKYEIQYFDDSDIKKLFDTTLLEKDNPVSQGKRLLINRLCLEGVKNTGEIINYDKKFYQGINILYAQNGKGKSSVFKIIKFALTGDKSSIKKDVLGWLKKIMLEFSIGDTAYTVFIDMTKLRVKSGLYRCKIDNLTFDPQGKVSIENLLIHFEENTETAFINNMQQFFFEQFSYYNLLWTSSSKGNFDLTDNKTTWKTYYKSIYLESKDYNVLFLSPSYGSQNKKILEMLLGLKYTASINTLSNRREHLENHLNQLKFLESGGTLEQNDVSNLATELQTIKSEINMIKQMSHEEFKKTVDIKFYNEQSKELFKLEKQIFEIDKEISKLQEDFKKVNKRIISLKEELEFGYYFSNLNVKTCPRCEHEIKDERKEIEKETHKCMLCDEELDPQNNNEYLEDKIKELESYQEKLSNTILKIKQNKQELENEQQSLREQLTKHEKKINNNVIEENLIQRLPDLIERKLELEGLINQRSISNEKNNKGKLKEELKIYEVAISYFNKLRLEESKAILDSLREIIKQRVNSFGLENVSDVIINDNFDIIFIQNEIENKFSELNEGEQLRAKLAVVLSLIVLDVKYNVGRHPRLLIIDSPGKEEVISKDLKSLASVFKEIENEFENELQIIIGTALDEFKNASVDYKVDIRESDENIF